MHIKATGTLDHEKNALIVTEEFVPATEIEHEYLKETLKGSLDERNDDVLVVTRNIHLPSGVKDTVKLAMLNKERASKGEPALDELPEENAKAVAAGAGEYGEPEDEDKVTKRHPYTRKH